MPSPKRALIRAVGKLGASQAARWAGRAFPAGGGGGCFQILIYHRVMPAAEPLAIDCVSVAAFEAQMARVAAHFRVVPLEQAWAEAQAGRIPPGTLCVTFDDGYADNCLHALPVLRRYGLPATVFLTTGPIGTRDLLWHDRVLHAFGRLRGPRFAWEEAGILAEDLSGPQARREAAFAMLGWLKGFAPPERDARIDDLWRREGTPPPEGPPRMLSWDQVRSMREQGISFGAHTVNHPILSRLTEAEAEAEIAASRRAIEENTGAACTTFAYPNGRPSDYNAACKAILGRLGFACALTTRAGVNTPAQDRFELQRTQIWEEDMDQLHGRLLLERALAPRAPARRGA